MGRLRINEHHWHWEGSLRVAEEAMSLLFILAHFSSSRLRMSLELFQTTGDRYGVINAYNSLSSIYTLRNNIDSAFKYQEMSIKISDSLFNAQKVQQRNVGAFKTNDRYKRAN